MIDGPGERSKRSEERSEEGDEPKAEDDKAEEKKEDEGEEDSGAMPKKRKKVCQNRYFTPWLS